MRKLTFALIALLALAVATWAGGDPWKKPAKEWDMVDVKRILTDSPWTRNVLIPFEASANVLSGLPNGPTAGPASDPGSTTGGEGNVPDQRGGGIRFRVQWASAMTLRRAAVRTGINQGTISQGDADASVSAPVDYYGVDLFGGNMLAFEKMNEAALEKVTYLKAKKNKEKVAPTAVEFQRGADGKTIVGLLFHFPKKLANGEAMIAPDEKSVEFVCKAGVLYIKTEFEPQKMATPEGPDW